MKLKDWIGDAAVVIVRNKIALEKYIQTPKGAQEAVEWLVIFFLVFLVEALWATGEFWYFLLTTI